MLKTKWTDIMHKVIALYFFLLLFDSLTAQNKTEEEIYQGSTFKLSLNQDNAFGFMPSVSGSIPRKKKKWDFTFYGNFWTNSSFANPDGSDGWLETGIGLSRKTQGGNWCFNPSIGLTHGKFLSNNKRGIFGEGIVPSILVIHESKRFEVEGNFSYYVAIRGGQRNKPKTDYTLGWAYLGMLLTKRVSTGFHVENLRVVRNTLGDPENLYSWAGIYLKMTVRNKYIFRFATGWNLELKDVYGSEYYRLTIGIPFD